MNHGFFERIRRLSGLILSLVVFALIVLLSYFVMGNVDTRSSERQISMVRDAVKRAAATCYAIEGQYPLAERYLREHYGLVYNEDQYVVIYDAFASNIMPDIRVIAKGAQTD